MDTVAVLVIDMSVSQLLLPLGHMCHTSGSLHADDTTTSHPPAPCPRPRPRPIAARVDATEKTCHLPRISGFPIVYFLIPLYRRDFWTRFGAKSNVTRPETVHPPSPSSHRSHPHTIFLLISHPPTLFTFCSFDTYHSLLSITMPVEVKKICCSEYHLDLPTFVQRPHLACLSYLTSPLDRQGEVSSFCSDPHTHLITG